MSKPNQEVYGKISIGDVRTDKQIRGASEGDIQSLAKSIELNGLLHPITVDANGTLLAGYSRLEAVKRLGWTEVPVRKVDIDDCRNQLIRIDENLIRNELSALETGEHLLMRDKILEEMGAKTTVGSNQHTLKSGGEAGRVFSAKQLASHSGMSDRDYRLKKQIARGLSDSVREKLRRTPFANATRGLERLSKESEEVQIIVVEKLCGGSSSGVAGESSRRMREEIKRAKAEIERNMVLEAIETRGPSASLDEYGILLHHADFRDVLKTLPDDFVDMIFTDPPYPPNFQHLYEDVAREGARLLREGGMCFMYFDPLYLFQIINRVQAHLAYYRQFIITGSEFMLTVHQSKIRSNYRPVLALIKGKLGETSGYFHDVLRSSRPEKVHLWQQDVGPAEEVIRHYTRPGMTVLDPMGCTMTTGVACLRHDRKFIGIEVDDESFKLGKNRLEEEVLELSCASTEVA